MDMAPSDVGAASASDTEMAQQAEEAPAAAEETPTFEAPANAADAEDPEDDRDAVGGPLLHPGPTRTEKIATSSTRHAPSALTLVGGRINNVVVHVRMAWEGVDPKDVSELRDAAIYTTDLVGRCMVAAEGCL